MVARYFHILLFIVVLISCGGPAPAESAKSSKYTTNIQKNKKRNCANPRNKKAKKLQEVPSLDNIEIPSTNPQCSSFQIKHTAYTVDYNEFLCIPNWVAYVLTREHTNGPYKRLNSFSPDPAIMNPVLHEDYTRNPGKYDRGHMAPAGDMKWSETAMAESFYTSNICPQNNNLNRGDWNDIEELVRDYANRYDSIFIVCGPIVNTQYEVIGRYHDIAVPAAFFKALLRYSDGKWYMLGFVCPNKAGNRPLLSYVVNIDEIERLTGHDLFWKLPDDIEDKKEKDVNLEGWYL